MEGMESYRPDQPHAATHLKMPAQVVRVADTEVEVAAVQHRYNGSQKVSDPLAPQLFHFWTPR